MKGRNNRHVPLILGIVSLGLALFLLLKFHSWWIYGLGLCFFIFGWVSIKTFLFASDKEISELTGQSQMSADTDKKFKDRI